MELGLASKSSCPKCGSQLLEGSSFSCQCGTRVREGEPFAPQLGPDAAHPQLELARAKEMPRFTPHAADEPICRFCKARLALSSEFCDGCGAPMSEAAPSCPTATPREIAGPLPGAAPHPVVSKESSPPVPSAARLAGPSTAKVTASPATLSYAASPSVPPRPEGKAPQTRPLNIVPCPPSDQPRALDRKPAIPASTLRASPPAPAQATSARAFALAALAVGPLIAKVGQLLKIVAALLGLTPAPRKIAGPLPGRTLIVSAPLRVPVRGEAVFPAQSKKPFFLIIVSGVAGLVLAIGMVAGWYLFHRKAQSAGDGDVTAEQVPGPEAPAEIAVPTLPPVNTFSPASELPKVRPRAPAPAGKSRRAKAASAAKSARAVPAADRKSAELVSLQNLALEASSKGNYVEPRDASAIAYSQRALALDPSNGYSRTILENSIKGGEYQVRQAILRKDFTTAHRVADALAQLLPGESAVADLKADLAGAEKAEEESRRAREVPAAVLSFRAYHMHSSKAPGNNGSYCLGTLTVVAGRLKYVGETAPDGQVHSFDIACSEVLGVKKNFRVAARENGFHVRTAWSKINFVPEDTSASHIPDLASACSR